MDHTYRPIPEAPHPLRKLIAGGICVLCLSLALLIQVKGRKALEAKEAAVEERYQVVEADVARPVNPARGYQLKNTSWDMREETPEDVRYRDWNTLEVDALPELGNVEFAVVER